MEVCHQKRVRALPPRRLVESDTKLVSYAAAEANSPPRLAFARQARRSPRATRGLEYWRECEDGAVPPRHAPAVWWYHTKRGVQGHALRARGY